MNPLNTWSDSMAEAHRRIGMLPLPPGRLDGLTVQLCDFAESPSFHLEHGFHMSLENHRFVLRAMRKALMKRGARVHIFTQTIDMVIQWDKRDVSHPPVAAEAIAVQPPTDYQPGGEP